MPKQKKEPETEENEPEIRIGGLGGVFRELTNLLSKVEDLAEKGDQIRELQDIAGVKGSRAIIGYNVRTIRGRRPIVRKFGNIRETDAGPVIEENRAPLVDIFDENDKIKVIAELPGVDKKDIKLNLDEKKLTISVDTEERKYYKEVELPSSAKAMTSGYKNGVLEVRLSKKKKEE